MVAYKPFIKQKALVTQKTLLMYEQRAIQNCCTLKQSQTKLKKGVERIVVI